MNQFYAGYAHGIADTLLVGWLLFSGAVILRSFFHRRIARAQRQQRLAQVVAVKTDLQDHEARN